MLPKGRFFTWEKQYTKILKSSVPVSADFGHDPRAGSFQGYLGFLVPKFKKFKSFLDFLFPCEFKKLHFCRGFQKSKYPEIFEFFEITKKITPREQIL